MTDYKVLAAMSAEYDYAEIVRELRQDASTSRDLYLADAIEELSRAAEVNAKRALKWAFDAEKAEEKLRWISAKERLPETARDVLVAFRLPIEKTYLITITQRASWSEKRKHDAFYQRGVTHWMEMPEPPKGE